MYTFAFERTVCGKIKSIERTFSNKSTMTEYLFSFTLSKKQRQQKIEYVCKWYCKCFSYPIDQQTILAAELRSSIRMGFDLQTRNDEFIKITSIEVQICDKKNRLWIEKKNKFQLKTFYSCVCIEWQLVECITQLLEQTESNCYRNSQDEHSQWTTKHHLPTVVTTFIPIITLSPLNFVDFLRIVMTDVRLTDLWFT